MKRKSEDLSSREILLVDDAQTVQLYAGAFRQSYRVLTTSSFSDAEQLLLHQQPELVVVEPSIGGKQGWEWVGGIIQTYTIPMIICSALDERKMGLVVGVSAYLIKPVPPALLSRTIASFLNRAR
ncbi:MAG: response regulator [Anaerolineae bacterium]|nr:response regulator [Anaerolineae bacterium]